MSAARLFAAVAVSGLLLTTAACGEESTGGSVAPSTAVSSAAAQPSVDASAAESSAADAAASVSEKATDVASDLKSAAQSVQSAAEEKQSQAADAQSKAATAASAASAASSAADGIKNKIPGLLVNTEDYKQGTGHYFTTPLTDMHCGQVGNSIGCQYFGDEGVTTLPQCSDPDTNAPMAIIEAGRARLDCSNQGFFVVENAKKLNVGQAIKLGDVVCTVMPESVSCAGAGGGFTFGPKMAAVQKA